MWCIKLAHLNIFPDWFLRLAIRIILKISLVIKRRGSFEKRELIRQSLIEKLKSSKIAIETDKPNFQHYEVPSNFFSLVLGRFLKYSCCYWPEGIYELDEAEEAMLQLTCERAEIHDGMKIIDLGCGWGAFSLWVAQKYPNTQITAISNSHTQKDFIDCQCKKFKIRNIKTLTADVADLNLTGQFDRVVSIEMFEHMRNYEALLEKIANFLKKEGKLFVHIFSNVDNLYEFDATDRKNWMAQTFFTGGIMPSDDLLLHFQKDLFLEKHWRMSGLHYMKTLNAWFARMKRNKKLILPVLANSYGVKNQTRWWVNWKLFFIGCAETWNLDNGKEYIISHFLFSKR